MTKPTQEPTWDETEVNSIEPTTIKKQEGWQAPGGIPEKPPFQTFNFWMNLVYKWINYFIEIITPIEERDFSFFGGATTNTDIENDAAFILAIAQGGRITFQPGTYDHTGIVIEDVDDLEFYGYGSVFFNKTTTGTAVLTLGDAAHLASSRRFKMVKIGLVADAAVTYGLQCLYATDSKFYDLIISSANIGTGIYIDFSWNNNFFASVLSTESGVEFGANNANNNNFFGGRMNGTSDALGIGVDGFGTSNSFFGMDISTFNYGVRIGGNSFTFNNCYLENSGSGTAFVSLGAISGDGQHSFINNFFQQLGGPAGNGIEHSGGVHNPIGVLIYNNRFVGLTNGIVMGAGAYGWDVRSNFYVGCTNNLVGVGVMTEIGVKCSISEDSKEFQASRLKYKVSKGSASGTVVIDAVSTITKDQPAFVTIHGIGRGDATTTRSFEAVAIINDDGSLSSYTLTLNNALISALQVNAGNLEVTTLQFSEWNFWIDSKIFYA